MRKLNFFASLFAIAVTCLAAQHTFACLCQPMTPKQRTKVMKINADAIFTGTVLSTVQIGVVTWETTFLIADSWKGEASGEITVQSSGGCRAGFPVGTQHLVYGKRNEAGMLVTENCWGTGGVTFRRDDLKRLGKPIRPKKDDKPQSRSANSSPPGFSLCV